MGQDGLHGHGELPLQADINVTSLVDVAFVLLIIFMITAPIMQGGVDVQLPRAQAQPLQQKEGLVVSVDRDGNIFVDDQRFTYAEFRIAFQSIVTARNPTGVYIRGDERASYGSVIRVMAVVRMAGITDVGMIVEDEELIR
jgi:biopolymer transport protein TolR